MWVPGAVLFAVGVILAAVGFLFVYLGGTEHSMQFAVPGIVLLVAGAALLGGVLSYDS